MNDTTITLTPADLYVLQTALDVCINEIPSLEADCDALRKKIKDARYTAQTIDSFTNWNGSSDGSVGCD